MAGWPRAPRDDDAVQRALRDGWMDGLATPVRSVVARQGGPGRGPSSRGRTVQMESCRDTCMLAALAYGSGASQPSLARVLVLAPRARPPARAAPCLLFTPEMSIPFNCLAVHWSLMGKTNRSLAVLE